MRFEWDPEKARLNLANHRVSFDDAQLVWRDPLLVLAPDQVIEGEERWKAFGMVGAVALLVVIHVYRGAEEEQRIRIISARKATKHERRNYEDGDL